MFFIWSPLTSKEIQKFIDIILKNVRTNTKYIFNNQQKYVKISLFGIGLNNDKNREGGGIISNAPHHIKHGVSY